MNLEINSIKEGRAAKKQAREEGIKLAGRNSEDFQNIVRLKLEQVIKLSIESNKEWLEKEWGKISKDFEDAQKINFEEVVRVFQLTLEKRIKILAQLEETSPEEITTNSERLATILNQAVFNFIMSIRKSKKSGDLLTQTLSVAGLSHWLNPNDIARLIKKYENKVDRSVIKSAALNHSENPDQFIDSCSLEMNRLTEEYEGKVNPSVISRAALYHPKTPEQFLDSIIQKQ